MQNQPKLVNTQQKNVQPTVTEHPFTYQAVNSLRSKSKALKHMVCELLDNSLDAQASVFNVIIVGESNDKNTKVNEIIVSDNGIGMTHDLLEGSFAIGRDQEAPRADTQPGEHGKYGLGGTLYSLVHFDKKETFTSPAPGELYKRKYDMAEVKKLDKWHSISEPLTQKENGLWNSQDIVDPGTTIRLTNPLPSRQITKTSAVSSIKSRLGYRYYSDILKKRIRIYVNGDEVEGKCPVMSRNVNVQLESKDIMIGGRKICTVTFYDLSGVPNLDGIDKNNQANAGIYARREGVLVTETPFWFGEKGIPEGEVTTKRQNDSKSRIMIEFTAESDDLMGIDNAKDDLVINQSVADSIYEFLKPLVQQQRRKASNTSAATNKKTVQKIEKEVSIVSNIDAIRPKQGAGSKPGRTYNLTGKYAGQQKNRPFVSNLTVDAFGTDPIYRVTPAGELKINTEHPFYAKHMRKMTERQLSAFAVLFMCLGATETDARMGNIPDAICPQTKKAMIDYFVKNFDRKLGYTDC